MYIRAGTYMYMSSSVSTENFSGAEISAERLSNQGWPAACCIGGE